MLFYLILVSHSLCSVIYLIFVHAYAGLFFSAVFVYLIFMYNNVLQYMIFMFVVYCTLTYISKELYIFCTR